MKSENTCLWSCFALILLAFHLGSDPSPSPRAEAKSLKKAAAPSSQRLEAIESLMNYMAEYDDFSGTVLLSEKGKTVYEKAFGNANRELGIKNTMNTAFDAASSIKPLVAAGALKLCENGKMSLDDEFASSFPDFPYRGVKIKHLLSHTSGLPEYAHNPAFDAYMANKMKEDPRHQVSNEDLIDWLRVYHKPKFEPGEKFAYCNANYVLLCSLIEKVSGLSFFAFIREYILKPADMTRSKLYDELGDYEPQDRAVGYDRTLEGNFAPFSSSGHIKGFLGDGGLYTTAGDLRKFLFAFLEGRIVSAKWRDMALTPFELNSGKSGLYGFGWIIRGEGYEGRPLTYKHGGRWEGFLNAFAYEPGSGHSIIVFSNTNIYPPTIGDLEKAFSYALSGNEPPLPRFPLAAAMGRILFRQGIGEAVASFQNLKTGSRPRYVVNENEMNYLALQLVWANKKNEALRILELNAKEFTESSNNYDSIGDIYLELGRPDKAREAYERALLIDPNNQGARKSLDAIKSSPQSAAKR